MSHTLFCFPYPLTLYGSEGRIEPKSFVSVKNYSWLESYLLHSVIISLETFIIEVEQNSVIKHVKLKKEIVNKLFGIVQKMI